MKFPKIEILAPNLNMLKTKEITLWYSYTTPVAFRVKDRQAVLDYKDSKVTAKHLNGIDGGIKAARVSQDTFNNLWNQLVKDYLVDLFTQEKL
jgi:hypothetical protein